MKLRTCFKTAFALLAFGAASAMANPLTVQAGGLPEYMGQGSYQSSFNFNDLLLPKKFTVNSLTFSFLFVDDGDTVPYLPGKSVTSTETVRQASGDPKGNQAGRTFTEVVTTTTTLLRTGVGEKESVKLSFGGVSFDGATQISETDVITPGTVSTGKPKTMYVKNNTDVGCLKSQWEAGTANCQQVTRTLVTKSQTRTVTTDYLGDIVFDGELQGKQDLVDALLRNRKLDFSLDVTGDLNFLGATVDLDFTPIEDASVVPEPASLSLFGIAMLGLAGMRRKRRA